MITRIKDNNKNYRFVTQQYEVGLYVAVYNDDNSSLITQYGVDVSEEEFHKKLREEYKDSLIID